MKIIYLTFLAGVALVAPLKAIDSDTKEFELADWRIRVDTLQYMDAVPATFGVVTPNPDATFLVIRLTVRNDRNTGETFIPQNWLKLLVAGKEIDCADLGVYLENIEPSLVKNRQAYFEVPNALLNKPMSIQFKRGWFGGIYNLAINQIRPSQPATTPAPVTEEASTATPKTWTDVLGYSHPVGE